MPSERRRTPRPAATPLRVETDADSGKVRVEADAVSPREMHAHLSTVYDKIGEVDDKVADVRVDFERRLGRIEKILIVIVIAVAAPKFGAPEIPKLTEALLRAVGLV